MTPDLWTRFADTVYGSHPWDGFSAYCRFDDGMTVVTTSGYHGGDDTWTIDDDAGIAHYVGDTWGAYIFGDFMIPAFGPTTRDWRLSYCWTSDGGA